MLLCLVACLTLLASFLLPSHLSLTHVYSTGYIIHVYVHVCAEGRGVHLPHEKKMRRQDIVRRQNSVFLHFLGKQEGRKGREGGMKFSVCVRDC